MARVTLNRPNEAVIVGGTDVDVVGNIAGGERVTVVSGNVRFDGSFSAGGDTIVLPGDASSYTAYRSGSSIVLTSSDGLVTVSIPVGIAGTEIVFNNGDSRTLLFNTTTNAINLEGQAISNSSATPTALTPAGPAPLVNYDVVDTAASIVEGDAGQRLLVYTINLDRPVTAADGPVTLNYQTQNGSANSASDYVAAAGQVTFAVGQQSATVSVVVNGDTTFEADETVNLVLTGAKLRNGPETLVGTIINDDAAPPSAFVVSGADASVVEGDTGTRQLVFTISLDRAVTAADGPVVVNYQTQDITASAASDYVATAGQVTFQVGQQTATISVTVIGDTTPEATEQLRLLLSGTRLAGSVALTGNIVNDDTQVSLTSAADNLVGSNGQDTFFAANNALGAGDKITDTTAGDNDTFLLAVDGSVGNRNFGGFALNGVENLQVTNDSGDFIRLDLSSSNNIASVQSVNSSDTVIFDQLTTNASVVVDNVTGEFADVVALYQAKVLEGTSTSVNVEVRGSLANNIILGNVNGNTSGIETVNLSVTGDSEINGLITDLTTLNISGSGSVLINNSLASTVTTINASTLTGDLDLNFGNANQGVTFTGAAGENFIVSSSFADKITTFGGDDTIIDFGGGNDTISTGNGRDEVILFGNGNANVNTGGDVDTVRFASGQFNGSDTVALGGSAGDTLVISAGAVEADFNNVTGANTLTVNTTGTTNLGNNGLVGTDKATLAQGQLAGIKTVNLNVGQIASDQLIATDFTDGLTVNLGNFIGADTVLLGTGADTINTGSFDAADVLTGNAGFDVLNVDGTSDVTAGNFSGIEQINYAGAGAADDQRLTLVNFNAPTDNGTLIVNASALRTSSVVADQENLFLDATQVSAYKVDVRGGASADTINTANVVADLVSGGGGADLITVAGGDTANGDAGNDTINIGGGNNLVDGGADNDTLNLNAGVGNSTIRGGTGNDRIVILDNASLTNADVLDGGADRDTLSVQGTFVDAQFTGVVANSIEVLEARLGATSDITLGAAASAAGFQEVSLLDTGADVLRAGTYTRDLTVTAAGGNDTINTGSGNDTVTLAGAGTYSVNTGLGNDQIRVAGTNALDAADTVAAGAGTDTIVLDNTLSGVTATVDLNNVTGVENYTVLTNGQRTQPVGNNPAAPDPDANVLTIGGAGDIFQSVTTINVNASALTDLEDSFRLVIGGDLNDDDVAFNVTGSATTTTVEKLNIGVDNNINFVGGTGADILKIDGADAGSTVTFDGGDGADDQIFQTGGMLTDDGFVGLSRVEVLTGTAGALNATLGAEADQAGINRILGTSGNDRVVLAAGFNNTLRVELNGGNDTINGAASTSAITFVGGTADIQVGDLLSGGSTAGDVILLSEGGSSNLSDVTGVETVTVQNSAAIGGQVTTIVLDAEASEVNGGRITINASAGAGDSLNVTSTNGAATAAALTINGGAAGDVVVTGGGADVVNGLAGADNISTNGGNDTVDGGAGADTVRGGLGNDTIDGGADADLLYGDFALSDFGGDLFAYNSYDGTNVPGSIYPQGVVNDVIRGGLGNDTIVGGLGRDTLTGNEGADVFRYQSTNDSRFFPGGIDNRDRITDFNVAEGDRIDLSTLAEVNGQTIRFNGNYATFGEAQSAISGTNTGDFLDVIYVQESRTLYVDVNNDGVLNGDDLQIVLDNVSSSFTLTGEAVNAGSVVNSPLFVNVAPAEDLAIYRFESVQFA